MTRTTIRSSLFASLLALGVAGAAEARDETLRWTHSEGSRVATFHLLVGTSPGSADLVDQAIGVPSPDSSGIYSYTLSLDTDATVYVRMTAVDSSSLHSPESNELERSVPLGMPGKPIVLTP